MSDVPATRGLYGQRPSKSADATRRREFERLAAMSPRERVLLALSLKERRRLMPHLIALKLYAGGWKSRSDVVELLERNRDRLDVAELRDVCTRHGLDPALEPLLQELGFA